MALIDRFTGSQGSRALRDALRSAKLVQGNDSILDALLREGKLQAWAPKGCLIEQNEDDNDLYIIIAGTCDIIINGRTVGHRGPGDHVGEMAAIEPTQKRSASAIAATELVALRISEPAFDAIANEHPSLYKDIAKELARRLLQRNALIGGYRERIRLFIISSVESLPIARAIQNAFEHDPFNVVIWTDGVFKISNYTLQSLEDEVDKADFAIAIAHADDMTEIRSSTWPTPRDNVIFELGLFMGRLGRARAILMEPRDEKVKLPSDLAGITAVPYKFQKGADAVASLGPACNRLREHINSLGPNNG